MRLISMTDYVEHIRIKSKVSPFDDEMKEIDTEELYRIFQYAQLLKQPLKLEMFIPVDENGNLLSEPTDQYNSPQYYEAEMDEYLRAKEKVLFKTKFEKDNSYYFRNPNGTGVIEYNPNIKRFYFGLYVLEDLVGMELELTDSAIKQLRLKTES